MKNYITLNIMVEKDAAHEVIACLDKACEDIGRKLYETASTMRYPYKPVRADFDRAAALSEQMVRLQDAIAQIKDELENDVFTEEEIPFGD